MNKEQCKHLMNPETCISCEDETETEKREKELMRENVYKYDNSRDLLKFIMDVATTNIDLTDSEKWKNEWRFIVCEIDEFLNG